MRPTGPHRVTGVRGLRNRGDAMRMRYERPPRWGGSEERIGRDNDAEGLCVKVGSPHPGPTGRCGRGG